MVRAKQKLSDLISEEVNGDENPTHSVPANHENPCCNENCRGKFSEIELKQIDNNFQAMTFEARNAFIRASVDNSTTPRKYTIFTKKHVKISS